MAIKIIGAIIGILIFGAGVYYLIKEKDDKESKKIYSIVTVIGLVIVLACAVLLVI